MGKIQLQHFAIIVERTPSIYRTGDLISGTVVIQLSGELNLNQLEIKLEGMAQVKWSERESYNNTHIGTDICSVNVGNLHIGQSNVGHHSGNNTRTVWYQQKHQYIDLKYYLPIEGINFIFFN